MDDAKKDYYKKRLSHYLKKYREYNHLTQSDVAVKLNYKTEFYRRIELEMEDRISNVFEYLENFANLTNKSIVDFVVYMEQLDITKIDRALFEWEKRLLDILNSLPSDERRKFDLEYISNVDKEKIFKIINIANKMSKIDKFTLNLIELIVESLTTKPLEKKEFIGKAIDKLESATNLLKMGLKKEGSDEK